MSLGRRIILGFAYVISGDERQRQAAIGSIGLISVVPAFHIGRRISRSVFEPVTQLSAAYRSLFAS